MGVQTRISLANGLQWFDELIKKEDTDSKKVGTRVAHDKTYGFLSEILHWPTAMQWHKLCCIIASHSQQWDVA